MNAPRIPLSTYRLQLNAEFTFRDAIGILDYLRNLGVSHVYTSPVFASRHGSGHGYDVTDPLKIDSDIGGEDAFDAFQHALEERGLGLIIDIVPNHMAASSENRWWMDVLEYGPDSTYASYFDINWNPPARNLRDRLLLPFLAKPFGEALDSGELQIRYDDGKFLLHYQEQIFPIAPGTYVDILRSSESAFRDAIDPTCAAADEWHGIISAAESVASSMGQGVQTPAERRTRFEQVRERLRRLLSSSDEIAGFVHRIIDVINGAGDPPNRCELERILSLQHYRLAFWQTTSDSINYRRFFSITDLVGVRVEDPAVFDSGHEAIFRVGSKAVVAGFRVDHIDGLRDPQGYLHRLRERLSQASPAGEQPYIVVEKILDSKEQLPANWPVEGTTGYDYLNAANRLFVDTGQCGTICDVYDRWTGTQLNFDDTVYQKKKLVMRTLLGVEMRALGRELAELASSDRYARELNPTDLSESLVEITACLSVYRTYVQALEVSEAEIAIVERAIAAARVRRTNLPTEAFDFLSDVLLVKPHDHVRADQREARLSFVSHWQQFTGSIMAKGVEDTALYVYFPLTALNEVGGDPRCSATEPQAFHDFIGTRLEKWPHTMNATTTHDTKRSEDARARIAVLSEIPTEWEKALHEWSQVNASYKGKVDGIDVPDRNEEYFVYQTLIGAWPLDEPSWPNFADRIQEYVIKATREASVRTRWTRPNQPHEASLRQFVASILDRQRNAAFCKSFEQFHQRASLYGMLNGLGQALLKIAAPGVPDCYQGSELWDLRLVDPDNRGRIDFSSRMQALAQLRCSPEGACARRVQSLLKNWQDGRVKLHVLHTALVSRQLNPELFGNGAYVPLEISGRNSAHVFAFARLHGVQNGGPLAENRPASHAIAVVPRCLAGPGVPFISANSGGDHHSFWENSRLKLPPSAPANWTNILAGHDSPAIAAADNSVAMTDIFSGFPVALLLPQTR